jgi:hypothetical protein
MKRLIAAITAVLFTGASLALTAEPAGAEPAKAGHASTSFAVCTYIKPSGFGLGNHRAIHYGPSHLYQCKYFRIVDGWILCRQYADGWATYRSYDDTFGECW